MSSPIAVGRSRNSDVANNNLSNSATSASLLSTGNAPNNALYSFKLLEALRSDDPTLVRPFVDELQPSGGSLSGQEDALKAGQLLGMAVRVASVPIIQLILSKLPSPNLPVASGSLSTPLHVASEIGRAEVVRILLLHPKINDTIRDDSGRTALEAASSSEVAQVIEDSRTTLQLKFLAQLAGYVSSPLSSIDESLNMTEFLESPRAEILNLNVLDEHSGTSLLHEAARRRDLRLVELAVKKGADVFLRDRKGRKVLEHEKNADERIKVFLKQFSNQDNLVQAKSDGRPPDLKGFLSKWVNYRSGWRTRWFVLENGILSYYRNREDEAIACRGSISLASASLHPSSDGSRFEVHSSASASVPKFIVKSAHRAEIARWVQTIRLNIEVYSKQDERGRTSETLNRHTVPPPARALSMHSSNSERPLASTIAAMPPTDSFLSPQLQRTTTSISGSSFAPHSTIRSVKKRGSSPSRTQAVDDAETMSIFEAAEKESLLGGDGEGSESHGPTYGLPHANTFDLGVLNIKAQIDLTQQLVDSIVTNPAVAQSSPGRGAPMSRTPSRQQAVKEALRSSLATLAGQISAQSIMSQDREKYLLGRIQREIEARRVWEENMLTVAQQQAEMDRQLTEAAKDNEKKRRALRQARGVLAGLGAGHSLPNSPGADLVPGSSTSTQFSAALDGASSATSAGAPQLPTTPQKGYTDVASPIRPGMMDRGSISNIQEVHDAVVAAGADSDSENEDDDEFFDAIEQNTLPNLRLYDSIAKPERPGTPGEGPERKASAANALSHKGKGSPKIQEYLARQSLEPYLHVRNRLPIDDDKRPSVSLWSILKSSVGKDLTKISFPVSFNECTSMLQRMAEDMEYDACLTVAAQEPDSLKRIAFVGAFAMSNYSSTIGRIAKPFNPLLSQSFEYAIPNRYRYISEQVSHHPPISACYCEAPSWKYFGEVDAQNKFQGRSFEIRPTGVAHAELVIPKSFVKEGLEYPPAGEEYGEDLVVEHYSWKKVTTNVSNFIMGSPIIDHYGDLVVTNHRTGETCTLTFKPRGWRGKDAFEIKGHVQDANENTAWDIAGRWDTQLVAREAGASSAPLDVDTQVVPSQKEYLLLWRNSEKPKAPFNLTPYAITLNDIPTGLRPYLCPTDCRLRTDQRAFENAEYDRAQGLKTMNEEKQRSTRKLRAEGKLPPHEARWFIPAQDPDTNERLWNPRRSESGEVAFWSEREKAGAAGGWEGIETIFATDDE